jgi:FMN phosphatase YigB (HAD superfamily)
MIGDSYEADIKGALDYGLEAIHLIAHGEALHSDCKIIHKLDELMKIL